jgi:hypothetical protein
VTGRVQRRWNLRLSGERLDAQVVHTLTAEAMALNQQLLRSTSASRHVSGTIVRAATRRRVDAAGLADVRPSRHARRDVVVPVSGAEHGEDVVAQLLQVWWAVQMGGGAAPDTQLLRSGVHVPEAGFDQSIGGWGGSGMPAAAFGGW